MIELTRLNGEQMVVNCDLIRYAEASPDTVITLVTGDKIVVSESTSELIERVIAFRSRLLRHAFPDGNLPIHPNHPTGSIAASSAQTAAEALPLAHSQSDQDESWRRRRREID